MSFSTFLLLTLVQVGLTAWTLRWYAVHHPEDAKRLFMKWRSFFSKS